MSGRVYEDSMDVKLQHSLSPWLPLCREVLKMRLNCLTRLEAAETFLRCNEGNGQGGSADNQCIIAFRPVRECYPLTAVSKGEAEF